MQVNRFHIVRTRRLSPCLILCLLLARTAVASESVWTAPSEISNIVGRGDMMFAATNGGLVVWTLPLGETQVITTQDGLPTNNLSRAFLHGTRDELLLLTPNGLARGWPGSRWETLHAEQNEGGTLYTAALFAPSQAWIVGGDYGCLLAWKGSNTERLQVPTHSRIVGLDHFPSWTDNANNSSPAAHGELETAQYPKSASMFSPGLLVATEDDGLWLLRSLYPQRWLQVSQRDGLPSNHLLHVVVDGTGTAWIATRSGIARWTSQLEVTAWPDNELLSQRGLCLFYAPSTHVYVGWWGGLFRIVTVPYDDDEIQALPDVPLVEVMPGITQATNSVTWANALWWTQGDSLISFLGAQLHLPMHAASNRTLALASTTSENETWLGHPGGQLSLRDPSGWQQFDISDGLPQADIQSLLVFEGELFVGSTAGLHRQVGLGSESLFQTVEQGPRETVRTQAAWLGSHWVGGSAGLWESDDSVWWRTPLWPGASEVMSLSATAETLWVTAGEGGIAGRVQQEWFEPQRDGELENAHFQQLTVSSDGVPYVATDRGVAVVHQGRVSLLQPPSPTPIQALCWQQGHLFVGTSQGLFMRTEAGEWRSWGVLDGLPGANILALAAGPDALLFVGTSNGAGLFLSNPQPVDTSVNGETAWRPASSRLCVLASRQGEWLQVVIPQSDVASMQLYDVRGRFLNDWRATQPGLLQGHAITRNGQRIGPGLYYGRMEVGRDNTHQTIRILVPR